MSDDDSMSEASAGYDYKYKAARLDRQLHVLEKFSLWSDPKVQGPLLFAAATSASTSTRHTIDNTGGKGDLRLAGNCLSEKMQTEINIQAKSKYLMACCYDWNIKIKKLDLGEIWDLSFGFGFGSGGI